MKRIVHYPTIPEIDMPNEFEDIKLHKNWFIPSKIGKIEEHYNMNFALDTLGEGAFARVVKATPKEGGVPRAVKIIKKHRLTGKDKERFRDEIAILKTMDHPNILKLIETFEDKHNVYIVTELCTGGELFDRILVDGFLTESEAKRVFKQILQAIKYCHSHGICHKDLKPENFLYIDQSPDANIKLIDFGFAQRFLFQKQNHKHTVHRMSAKVGTAYYIAPEVLNGNYNEECDIWSAGVILYIMLSGIPPFNGETDKEICEHVKRQKYDFKGYEWSKVSEPAKNLISQLLTTADKRLTADGALAHPWMQSKPDPHEKPLHINFSMFKNFVMSRRFKRIALTAMASRLSECEIKDLSAEFRRIDKNGDGVLTFDELKEGLHGVKENNCKEIMHILNTMDLQHNGTVDYTEFIAATMQKNLYLRSDKLLDAFSLFDADRDGKISAEELKNVLERDSSYKRNIEYYNDMIREVDRNGDGMIDYEEFIQIMTKDK